MLNPSRLASEWEYHFRLGPSQRLPLGGGTVRINSDCRRCVVFFGKASPPDGEIKYGGTGFLLCDRERENTPYLITCRHVAGQLEEEFVIRVNKRGGDSVPLPFSGVSWRYHPDKTVDLAATILPLDANIYDVVYFNTKLIQPYDFERVLCGDPISLVGLFRLHAGSRRNVPIVHSGNVAALPDANEKIPLRDRATGKIVEVEGYLVEAQTLEGLSGSPAFIQQFQRIPGLKTPQGGGTLAYGDAKILGLYQGAWDGEPGAILAADRNLAGGLRVPVGMGIIVPGERILELINDDPEFKATREDVRQERLRKNAASTDAGFSGSAKKTHDPATDANPNGLEDFMRLVDVAARKRKQADQT